MSTRSDDLEDTQESFYIQDLDAPSTSKEVQISDIFSREFRQNFKILQEESTQKSSKKRTSMASPSNRQLSSPLPRLEPELSMKPQKFYKVNQPVLYALSEINKMIRDSILTIFAKCGIKHTTSRVLDTLTDITSEYYSIFLSTLRHDMENCPDNGIWYCLDNVLFKLSTNTIEDLLKEFLYEDESDSNSSGDKMHDEHSDKKILENASTLNQNHDSMKEKIIKHRENNQDQWYKKRIKRAKMSQRKTQNVSCKQPSKTIKITHTHRKPEIYLKEQLSHQMHLLQSTSRNTALIFKKKHRSKKQIRKSKTHIKREHPFKPKFRKKRSLFKIPSHYKNIPNDVKLESKLFLWDPSPIESMNMWGEFPTLPMAIPKTVRQNRDDLFRITLEPLNSIEHKLNYGFHTFPDDLSKQKFNHLLNINTNCLSQKYRLNLPRSDPFDIFNLTFPYEQTKINTPQLKTSLKNEVRWEMKRKTFSDWRSSLKKLGILQELHNDRSLPEVMIHELAKPKKKRPIPYQGIRRRTWLNLNENYKGVNLTKPIFKSQLITKTTQSKEKSQEKQDSSSEDQNKSSPNDKSQDETNNNSDNESCTRLISSKDMSMNNQDCFKETLEKLKRNVFRSMLIKYEDQGTNISCLAPFTQPCIGTTSQTKVPYATFRSSLLSFQPLGINQDGLYLRQETDHERFPDYLPKGRLNELDAQTRKEKIKELLQNRFIPQI